jgi:formate dehydrogenase
MAKILCVLYDDPVRGYPTSYARNDIPTITHYDNGQTVPSPKRIDFVPGHLLGSVSGELGLRKYLESLGHTFIVTADKEARIQFSKRSFPMPISSFHNRSGRPISLLKDSRRRRS